MISRGLLLPLCRPDWRVDDDATVTYMFDMNDEVLSLAKHDQVVEKLPFSLLAPYKARGRAPRPIAFYPR